MLRKASWSRLFAWPLGDGWLLGDCVGGGSRLCMDDCNMRTTACAGIMVCTMGRAGLACISADRHKRGAGAS